MSARPFMTDEHFNRMLPTIRSVEELDGFRLDMPEAPAFTDAQIRALVVRRLELLRDAPKSKSTKRRRA